MEWDDLRYVLAVHRAESVAAAARTLGVSNVTVFRRIEALEKSLGVRLFDRTKQGYIPTVAAAEIVEQAGRIEEQIKELESRVWKHDSQVRGTVRLATVDTWGSLILPEMLVKLRELHPDLHVELLLAEDMLSITKREADIALRTTAAPPENLVGHRLGVLRSSVYAEKTFAARHLRGKKKDLSSVPWLAPGPNLAGQPLRISQWIAAQGYERRIVLTCDSVLGMVSAVKAGLGVGIMSDVVADALGGLAVVSPRIPELDREVWLLIHPDLRDVARVTAVYGFLRAELGRVFSGE
jgi:DNA-binding transcriptional LysR family regulator